MHKREGEEAIVSCQLTSWEDRVADEFVNDKRSEDDTVVQHRGSKWDWEALHAYAYTMTITIGKS